MNILIITQVYWPDTASTAQHLADLGENLVKKGHKVKVLTSTTAYENKSKKFLKIDDHLGVNIYRISSTSFGKSTVIGRLIDFFSFNMLLFLKLILLKKRTYDVIIGMTSPPLISLLGAWVSKLKKIKFCYWTMDLQPELAIHANYLRANSIAAKYLTLLGDYIFKKADSIITLDKYMYKHVINRGASTSKVSTIPVWPIMKKIYEGDRLENPFRKEHEFNDKIVLMYSGNHAIVHPLDTILETALSLKDNKQFLFVFIGDGVRKKDVTNFKNKYQLKNIIQLPYQPREKIHLSLGASDIQIVILGDNLVGFTHPNKIYGAMYIGKTILYIGPEKSHITDILKKCQGNISVKHGENKKLKDILVEYQKNGIDFINEIGQNNQLYAQKHFNSSILIGKMIDRIEILHNKG